MDSYTPLLERTRVPQPSIQSHAVISIFDKFRSSPPHLIDVGREAITQCLLSSSPAVVDQSVRQICRLVSEHRLSLSEGLMELQSALEEASHSHFVHLFVRGLGFLVRLGFRNHPHSFRFSSSHAHPFVKILSCRIEVQSELVEQVILFMALNKNLGMLQVCEFISPFLNFMTIRMSDFSSFSRTLFSSMVSLCCSYPLEAVPVMKLLMRCLRFFPCKNEEEISNVTYFLEHMVDMFIVVLRRLVGMELLVHEVQLQCVELLETIFSVNTYLDKGSCRSEAVIEISRRLLAVQSELSLSYIPEISSVVLSLFLTLVQAEFEHKQLSILRMLLLLFKWKGEKGNLVTECLGGELLFIFPLLNLMSSPSISVKQAATNLLSMLYKSSINLMITQAEGQVLKEKTPSISRPEHIFYRLLQHLWYQDHFLSYASSDFVNLNGEINVKATHHLPKRWTDMMVEYVLGVVERGKSSIPISQCENILLKEMAPYLSSIMSVLVLHRAMGASAVDLLAVTGDMNPKFGVPLLLAILFYNNIICAKDLSSDFHQMLLKLLGILPSLASHPAMIPLVVQTILPMLQNDTKPTLYATATRVLCKTWEISDRVFGSLQSVLLPQRFIQYASERDICISMAISIRDVCKRDPDRGVDLILSVSACIESRDPSIHTIGLLSLAHLCEADVIDFYTAWGVIRKHLLNYLENPVICHGISILLRCGAMDAAAFPEAANDVLQKLWEIGTTTHPACELMWTKARAAAFESLTHYEQVRKIGIEFFISMPILNFDFSLPTLLKVLYIQNSIPEFKERNMEFLTAETHTEVLRAMEKFEKNIIKFEHQTRQRLVKEKRLPQNKIEKLVNVFPQLNFKQGDNKKIRDLPGAALFCLTFTHDVNNHGAAKDLHARFRTALMDIAASLYLSRNILVAVLSFQSWKVFMQHWIKAQIVLNNVKGISTASDNTNKLASDILKSIIQMSEESIPRIAENIALAVGAFCMVLPPSAHAVKSTALKFLLNWLFQYEHEYRQWSSAISIGAISSDLHATDDKQKFQNINALLEVASICKSTLVKGACGLGLGLSSQHLFTRVQVDESDSHKETYRMQETSLLGRILRALCQMLSKITRSSSDALELQSLSAYFGQATDAVDSESLFNIHDNLEEDVWGIAGVVLGLGSTVTAVYRTGNHDAVRKISGLIKSWIQHINPSIQKAASSEKFELALSVGSCLALPILVDFFRKMDNLDDSELDNLISGFRDLISELLSVNKSGILHQSLLFASCTGVGNLLACILNEGVHPVQVEYINEFLMLFKKCYTSSYPPLVHLGGMLGIVNILGAGAGSLFQRNSSAFLHPVHDHKQFSYIMGPLLSSSAMEPILTSLIQDIFLVAQKPSDHQLQSYAAWAISFLRHYLWFMNVRNEDNNSQRDAVGSKFVSLNFPDDSLVMKLSLWLMNHNFPGTDTAPHVNTVATALRCLTSAPRLPLLDWGAIIRRCVRYDCEDNVLLPPDLASSRRGFLREECLIFSLAHAKEFDPLLIFLDELSDLSRFRTLELDLQCSVLSHLADVIKVFSGSRIEKLFADVANFIKQLVPSDQLYNSEQKSLLRISCWKGLSICLNRASTDGDEYVSYMENCMKVLFCSTSFSVYSAPSAVIGQDHLLEEWSVAIKCLSQARQAWLLDFLKVSEVDFRPGNMYFLEVKKKIQATCRLVRIGSIPLTHIGSLKASMLNTRSQDIWEVLVEVAATLQHADGTTKRQWVFDAAEICCVTSHPSTALQFLGLLCGSFSKYMPFLIVDRFTVLCDLPVVLASLLSESYWGDVAESVVSLLWTTTERLHVWVADMDRIPSDSSISQYIDRSEDSMADFLLQLLQQACVYLKDYLPIEKQLSLANMVIP